MENVLVDADVGYQVRDFLGVTFVNVTTQGDANGIEMFNPSGRATVCNFRSNLGIAVTLASNDGKLTDSIVWGRDDIAVLVYGDDCLVAGNRIRAEQDGVVIEGFGTQADRNIVRDNHFFWPGDDLDDTYDVIRITDNADKNVIDGNIIHPDVTDQPRYGINIDGSTCLENVIGHNSFGDLTDYGTFPLQDLGTDTRYPAARTADMSVGGALTIGQGAAWYPFAGPSIFLDAHPTAGVAPSGGPVTVDIEKNETTSAYVTATNPSIASGTKIGSRAPGDPMLFVEDDYISLNLDAVNGAENLTCVVRFLEG